MRILLSVIDDLWKFALTEFFNKSIGALLPIPRPLRLGQRTAPEPSLERVQATDENNKQPEASVFSESGSFYFIGVEQALFHTDPVVAFDVVCGTIPYGEPVRLLKLGGRWANVRFKNQSGWVFKDALREQARDVFPQFVPGEIYDANSTETFKLRLCIKDAFCGQMAFLTLTDAEYVTYKLYQKQISLPWTQERPRTPGTWQKKLRGIKGVRMGIAPQANSVMEYLIDNVGYVGFVEAVFPDDSIKLSAVGLQKEGEYSETMLSKEQWREFRPVFIEAG